MSKCICTNPWKEKVCPEHWYVSQEEIDLEEKVYRKSQTRDTPPSKLHRCSSVIRNAELNKSFSIVEYRDPKYSLGIRDAGLRI